MRFESLQTDPIGPIPALNIRFGPANLIVGKNEHGKTTLVDILIHSLFPKKTQFSKRVVNDRFDFSEKVRLTTSGKPLTEEMQKYYSLFIIREGETAWTGRSGKADLLSRDLWNEDIRELIFGSDTLYTRINRDLEKTLGVSKSNSWLKVLQQNFSLFARTVASEVRLVDDYKDNEGFLAERKARLKEVEDALSKLSGARKGAATRILRENIEKFFLLNDKLTLTKVEAETLKKRDLAAVRTEWEKIRREMGELEKEVREAKTHAELDVRVTAERGIRLVELETENKSLKERIAEIDLSEHKQVTEIGLREKNILDEILKLDLERHDKFPVLPAVMIIGGIGLIVAAALGFLSIIPLGVWLYAVGAAGAVITAGGSVIVASEKKSLVKMGTRIKSLTEERSRILKTLEADQARINRDREVFEGLYQSNIEKMENLKKGGKSALAISSAKEERLSVLREKDNRLTATHHSYEEVIRDLEKLNHLTKNLTELEESLKEVRQKLQETYQTDSPSFLQEELKKLRLEESSGPGGGYREDQFEKLSRERDEIQSQISRKKEENQRLESEVTTRISEGIKNLGNNVKPQCMDSFYSRLKGLNLSHDIFNIYAFREVIAEIQSGLDRDVRFSELLSAAYNSLLSDTDGLFKRVFRSEAFERDIQKLTAGNYQSAEFRSGEEVDLLLVREDGSSYPFETLSTGTRNQLHFAFRLSMAREIAGEPGVFILDDAFLTYDVDRRRSAVGLLRDYAAKGWQIIYAGIHETVMEGIFDEVFGKELNKIIL